MTNRRHGNRSARRAGCPLREESGMTHQEHPNVALVREGYAAFQRGDTEWMDQHLADDAIWYVGGNSKWSGEYRGKANVLDFFARQVQALGGQPPTFEIHDVLGNDEHVVAIGTATATAANNDRAEWKYVQVFHVRDGKVTESWGMADNDALVDPFLDNLAS